MTDQSQDAFKEARASDEALLAALEQEQDESSGAEPNPYLEGFEAAEEIEQERIDEPKPCGHQTLYGRSSLVLAVIGLVAGAGAGGMAVYSNQQAIQVRADAGSAFDHVSHNVQALSEENLDLKTSLNLLESRLKAAESALNRINTSTLKHQINAVNASVETLGTMVQGQKAFFESRIRSVSDENRRLEQSFLTQQEAALERIQQLTAQQKSIAADRSEKTTRVNSQPSIRPILDIEGARLVTMDRWGAKENVILKEAMTGDWVTLEVGDQYKGWTVTRIDSAKSQVLMSKDGKTFALEQSSS